MYRKHGSNVRVSPSIKLKISIFSHLYHVDHHESDGHLYSKCYHKQKMALLNASLRTRSYSIVSDDACANRIISDPKRSPSSI